MAITITGLATINTAGAQTYTLSCGSLETITGINVTCGTDNASKYISSVNRSGSTLTITFADVATVPNGASFTIAAYGSDSTGTSIRALKNITYYNYRDYGSSIYLGGAIPYNVADSGERITMQFSGPTDFTITYPYSNMVISNASVTSEQRGGGYLKTLYFDIVSADKNGVITPTITYNGTQQWSKSVYYNTAPTNDVVVRDAYFGATDNSRYAQSLGAKLLYDGDTLYLNADSVSRNIAVLAPTGWNIIDIGALDPWLSVTTSQYGYLLEYSQNNTGAIRTNSLIVTYDDGNTVGSTTINIRQGVSSFTVDTALDCSGGPIITDVYGFTTPSASNTQEPIPAWITMGADNFSVSANNGGYRDTDYVDLTLSNTIGNPNTYTIWTYIEQRGNGTADFDANKTIPKAAGYVEIPFIGTYTNGLSTSSSAAWLTVDAFNPNLLRYTENNTGSDRTATLTWTYYGFDAVTLGTTTITQISTNPTITVTPSSRTLANTETSTTYTVTHPAEYTLSWNASGNVSIDYQNSYLETVDSTTKILHIVTNDNTTLSSQTSSIVVTGVSGSLTIQSDPVTLIKQGTPGGIVISPVTADALATGDILTFTVTCTNMQLNTLLVNGLGTITVNSATINAAGTELTVDCGNNPDNASRYFSLTIYGTDIYGNSRSSNTITINQDAIPNLSVSPSTIILGPTEQLAQYEVLYTPSNATLSYNISAGVSIDTSRTGFVVDPQTGVTYLRVYTNDNTTTSTLVSPIDITVSSGGVATFENVTLRKQGTGGTISVNPSSQTVTGSAGSFTVDITATQIITNTINSSVEGALVDSVTFNAEKTVATINYTANSTSSERTAVVTIYGNDIYANRKSATVTITQQSATPTISVSPSSTTATYDDASARYTVTHTPGITLGYTSSGTISIDHTSFEVIDATHSYFYVYPDANTSSSSKQSTFKVTTSYYGTTIESNSFTLTQQGVPGSLELDPSTASVGGSSGTVGFDVFTNNIQTSTLSATVTGTMNNVTAGFNSDKSRLIVTYGANSGSSTLSANVVVSGNDNWGNLRSDNVTITQYPKGTITFSPATANVGYLAGSQIYALVLDNVAANTISVSTNKSWATATYDSNTRQVSVAYTDNGTGSSRTATITATGTDSYGVTVSGTGTITQSQSGQISITCSPASRTVAYNTESCYFYVNYTEGLQLVWTQRDGDLVVDETQTGIVVDPTFGDTYFYVYPVNNSSGQTKTGTFVLSAIFGGQIYTSNTITVYQTGVPGTIDIDPLSKSVSAVGGTTTFNVSSSNINLSTMMVSVSSSTMNITRATLDSSKTLLTVVYGASSSTSQLSASLTVSGQDYRGVTISKTATLTQNAATPYLTITPNTYNAPSRAGVTEFRVDYFAVSNLTVTHPGDITSTVVYDATSQIITYSYNANPNTLPRTGQVVVTGTRDDNQQQIVAAAVITQAAGVVNSISPIWDDVIITESPVSSFVEYHIDLNGDTIYAGKAYKYPGAANVKFAINDVASNYLGNGIAFTNGCNEIPNYAKTFEVTTSGGTTYIQDIYNSWAYEDTDYWLSDPIDYRVSCLQWLPVSIITTNWNSITVNSTAYGNLTRSKGYTAMQNLRNYATSGVIPVYGADGTTRNYKISDGDYVLYYVNAFGGWDSLLCNSTSKKTDNIETLSYRKKSSSMSDFSKVDYQKVIKPTWSLNTGIIQNGEKMYHLLESTMVYLHNLKTNEIIPVTITNSTCEYLNYTNNGKQPVKYNITVEESNQRIRK